jgi:hypothetical protein
MHAAVDAINPEGLLAFWSASVDKLRWQWFGLKGRGKSVVQTSNGLWF